MKRTFKYLIIILLLFWKIVYAQESTEDARWSIRITPMAGCRPIDRWGKYSPEKITRSGDAERFASYSAAFHLGVGTAYKYDDNLSLLWDVAFENALAKGHSAAQRHLITSLSGEYRIKLFYAEMGWFLGCDPETNAFVYYPAGTVRASRFHYGPELGMGVRFPFSNGFSMRVGAHVYWGLHRYCNYGDRLNNTPEYIGYKSFFIIPTYLFSLQLEKNITPKNCSRKRSL